MLRDFWSKVDKAQLEFQKRVIEHTQAIKDDTDEIKKTTQATRDAILGLETKLTNPSNRYSNVSIPDAVTAAAVATEHQSQIDNARDLLKKGRPRSALDLLEVPEATNLDERLSQIVKFHILTSMAASSTRPQ